MALPIPRLVTLRAAAVLLGANAFDAAPLEVYCGEYNAVTLYISFTRGAAAGGVTIRPEVSPYTVDSAVVGQASWFRTAEYAPAVLAAGADSASRFQREAATYQAVGATQEAWTYGPIQLGGSTERFRVACAESGGGAVGTCEIVGVFS